MKDLEVLLERTGHVLKGSAIDLGDWDVAVGFDKSFYLRNPNQHAKADLRQLKNSDTRVDLKMPDEILPLDTVRVDVTVQPQIFDSEAEETQFFQDVLSTLTGKIVWRKP